MKETGINNLLVRTSMHSSTGCQIGSPLARNKLFTWGKQNCAKNFRIGQRRLGQGYHTRNKQKNQHPTEYVHSQSLE